MENRNKVRARIIERYGSQTAFAAIVGVSEGQVSKVLRGRRQMDPESREEWAALLGLDESIFDSPGPALGGSRTADSSPRV